MTLHANERRERLAALRRACRDRGLPLTVQRRLIYEVILDQDGHPTAEEVYAAVRERLPGISRTTVYRTLETLVALGVIGKPAHRGSVARYDRSTQRHHHLVCVRCEQTVDLESPLLDRVKFPDTRGIGFQIADYSIHFTGLCGPCREQGRTDAERSGRARGDQRRSGGACGRRRRR
jgi:Fur family peroxide stress response transcriptional regulator